MWKCCGIQMLQACNNMCVVATVPLQNYDGPDMTYYFDKKGRPPSGPEDDDDSDKPHDK